MQEHTTRLNLPPRQRAREYALALAVLGVLAVAALWAPTAQATPLRGDTHSAPRCEIDKRLDVMALVYNDRDPERSFAMVAGRRGAGRMIGVGSHVLGRVVLAVLPQALWLGPADDPCWMPLSHDGAQRTSKTRKPKRKKRRKRR